MDAYHTSTHYVALAYLIMRLCYVSVVMKHFNFVLLYVVFQLFPFSYGPPVE